jgi:hypothetical protein
MQIAFLNALSGEAKGDLHAAKRIAGYSDSTALADVIRPLKDHIIALAKDVLVNASLKAAFGLIDVIDSPAQMGAAHKVKASTEILNRVGITPPEDGKDTGPKSAVFILPPKNIANIVVDNGKITVDMSDDEPKIVEAKQPEESDDEPV